MFRFDVSFRFRFFFGSRSEPSAFRLTPLLQTQPAISRPTNGCNISSRLAAQEVHHISERYPCAPPPSPSALPASAIPFIRPSRCVPIISALIVHASVAIAPGTTMLRLVFYFATASGHSRIVPYVSAVLFWIGQGPAECRILTSIVSAWTASSRREFNSVPPHVKGVSVASMTNENTKCES